MIGCELMTSQPHFPTPLLPTLVFMLGLNFRGDAITDIENPYTRNPSFSIT